MATPDIVNPARSYGCSWGCGNPYDFITIDVSSGTVEFLCLPCHLKFAEQIITAVTDPENAEVMQAIADAAAIESAPMRNNTVRPRGKNAPADIDDPDLLEAFDSVITVDELPEEFR